MRRRGFLACVAAVVVFTGTAAFAAFAASATAQAEFSTDSLAPPSALTAKAGCGLLQYEVDLSWTATTSTWADGYEVSMATSQGGPYSVVPLPLGGDPLATTRKVGWLQASTTYWFRVKATKGSWRSSHIEASAKTPLLCVI